MGWVLPTGHNDPSSAFANETLAYDNDTYTFSAAQTPANSWSAFLELTHASLLSTKLRFKCWVHYGTNAGAVDIDAYYSGAWHDVYQGSYTLPDLNEKLLGGSYNVTAIRIRVQNNDSELRYIGVHEVHFYEIILPTVTTQAVTDILSITATGNGNITYIGSQNATKRGVCWNTTGSPTIADSKSEETGSFGIGAFTRPMTSLSPGVQYFVKAYAYNEAGYAYGGEVNFTTDKVAPTVTTQSPTDILPTTATANGNITALGGENSTVRGFQYGLTKVATWNVSDSGSFGAGAFTKALTGLSANTTYWIRAYATNSIGTGYGAWVEFQTAAVGVIPTGTRIFICSDYSGYTYKLQRSETDDGLSYTAYFVINTDLTPNKTGLTYHKIVLDLDLYFRCEASGTAEIYVKRDSEADWQYLGSVGLTDVTEPTIIIKHLPIAIRAKVFDFKISYGNACRFLGVVFDFIPGGER